MRRNFKGMFLFLTAFACVTSALLGQSPTRLEGTRWVGYQFDGHKQVGVDMLSFYPQGRLESSRGYCEELEKSRGTRTQEGNSAHFRSCHHDVRGEGTIVGDRLEVD